MKSVTREAVSEAADTFCNILRDDMKTKIMAAYDALTQEERDEFSGSCADPGNPHPVVRILGMAVGDRVVNDSFAVEAIKRGVVKAKRILTRRYFR